MADRNDMNSMAPEEYSELKKQERAEVFDLLSDATQKLLSGRYKGDESKKDLHEKNVRFLLDCRESALYAAEKLGWKRISCCENGEMRTIEAISNDILKIIEG